MNIHFTATDFDGNRIEVSESSETGFTDRVRVTVGKTHIWLEPGEVAELASVLTKLTN